MEFPVFRGVCPLVSGYLEASARQNPQIKDRFEFQKHSIPIGSRGTFEKINAIQADIFGFSCYVWNTGLVKRLLPSLLARRPSPWVILGGPQVMNQPERYLDSQYENLLLCNGEGEHTFINLLVQLTGDQPDLAKVNGLSFYRNAAIITTPKQDRTHDLDMIPSPYLNGCFQPGGYSWAVIETNRGCPFTCTYCYWGAATNAKVHTFSMGRILRELTWMSENRVLFVFIADANFGMLKRDLKIAEHLAQCCKKTGYPTTVCYSSSKNTPERVIEITRAFKTAGLIAAQEISLQTMNPDVLKKVRRDNIKTSTYTDLQRSLNERGLSSFLEIIWPLPGETLASFKKGLGQLCSQGADSFLIYPLVMINNVEMGRQREEFGLVTINDPDPNSEAEIVVATKDVSRMEYLEGLRFVYHVMSLYSMRGLWHVGRHLDSQSMMFFADLISCFSDFCLRTTRTRYNDYIENVIDSSRQYRYNSYGGILHVVLHDARDEFDNLLLRFMRTLPCWVDPEVRFLFELDLFNRPHIYYNTPITTKPDQLEWIRVLSVEKDGYLLKLPAAYLETARKALRLDFAQDRLVARVKCRTNQFPFMPGKSLDDNYTYCHDQLRNVTIILPVWSLAEPMAVSTPVACCKPPEDTTR
ncbi:MAG: radical SAM protein [Verrucomicrobiota bacterium]